MPDPSPTILVARPDGSFRLEWEGGQVLETVACAGGYEVRGGAGPDWWLQELPEYEAGWVLRRQRSGDAEELGRTTRAREGDGGLPASLLLEDGRLMRIVPRMGRQAHVALIGDEVSGAYIEAAPRQDAWVLTRTAAGLELELGAAGWLLFAAEIARTHGG